MLFLVCPVRLYQKKICWFDWSTAVSRRTRWEITAGEAKQWRSVWLLFFFFFFFNGTKRNFPVKSLKVLMFYTPILLLCAFVLLIAAFQTFMLFLRPLCSFFFVRMQILNYFKN